MEFHFTNRMLITNPKTKTNEKTLDTTLKKNDNIVTNHDKTIAFVLRLLSNEINQSFTFSSFLSKLNYFNKTLSATAFSNIMFCLFYTNLCI